MEVDMTNTLEPEAHKRYEQKSTELFERWKAKPPEGHIDHGRNVFIADGVACPEQWFSQDVRPLFLLKEAYGGSADWDLRDHFMKDEPMIGNTTWRRITQWTCGIMNTTAQDMHPFERTRGRISFGNDQLQKIAVVNVKKSGGKPRSNDEDLAAYAEYDKAELAEQIKLIDPTVIVCGYTCDYLATFLKPDLKAQRNDSLFYALELNGRNVIVLDYWHPSNQYPDLMNYYGLMGAYQQALRKMGQR